LALSTKAQMFQLLTSVVSCLNQVDECDTGAAEVSRLQTYVVFRSMPSSQHLAMPLASYLSAFFCAYVVCRPSSWARCCSSWSALQLVMLS
jgi:hypothetical protein